jgi:holin-like protein
MMSSEEEPAQTTTPNGILRALTVLASCQLGGELLAWGCRSIVHDVVFPGPVAGMLLLFVALSIRGKVGHDLTTVSSSLLGMLSLLFIPSAVGIIQYGPVLAQWGLQLVFAVVVSTVITLIVTVFTFLATERLTRVDRQ